MRKKIQNLIRGTYEYQHPKLIFSEEKIAFDVREEETYHGSFQITVSDEQRARGMICCKNPRMKCVTTQFDGMQAQIEFVYEAANVTEGNPDNGQFVISSSCGEYLLPFTANPVRYYHRSSIGKIKTINDFANLAKLNWEEALCVFQSKYFKNIFPDMTTELLYEGLCSRGCTSHEMEEFLIGIGKKKRSFIQVGEKEIDLGNLSADSPQELKVSRTEWGYADLYVSCDAPFIRLEKTRILSDDFIGKKAVIPYVVCVEKMHAGINCAKITLQTAFECSEVQIQVKKSGESRPDVLCAARRFQRKAMFTLEKLYIDYRLNRVSTEDWTQGALELLQEMEDRNPSDIRNALYRVHVLLLAGKKEEADNLLEDVSAACRKKHTVQWGYFRFLDYLYEYGKETSAETEKARDVLIQDLQMVIRKNPDQLLPIQLTITLCEDYGEQLKEKYVGIKNCIEKGWASPLLYMEAYLILKSHPQILRGIDNAEFRILYWIARQKLLTEQMISVIINAASRETQFRPRFFWLLGRCYKVMRSDMVIRAICTYLIKNNQSGEMYLSWFAKGVEKHMRIAGLCEAYLQSWRKNDGDIPKNVIQYFSQKTEIPAVYRARIYAYAVRKRKSLGREWQIYEKLAAAFVTEELQRQHMSDDIAEICRYFILYKPGEVRQEVLEQSLRHYKVTCSENLFSGVVVCEESLKTEETIPIVQNTAFFIVHGKNYRVLFEDNFGRRCCLTEGFRLNPVIPGENRRLPGQKYVKRESDAESEKLTKKKEDLSAGLSAAESEEDTYYDMLGLETMDGSIDELDRAIRQAETSGIDVSEYQEELLTRMIFSEVFPEDHVEYFRAICKMPQTEQLRQAYVSYFSRNYVYDNENVPEEIFEYLQYSFRSGRKINYCCETAMLKWYCEHGWDGKEKEFRNLFESAIRQGRYFPFYTLLPERFLEKYLLHDRRYLSLSAVPEQTIHCVLQIHGRGTVSREDVTVRESIPGLYVLPVYLFAGDLMEYRFYDSADRTLKSGTERLTPSEIVQRPVSRYHVLNQALEETVTQTEKLKKYAEMMDMTADLFQPL